MCSVGGDDPDTTKIVENGFGRSFGMRGEGFAAADAVTD